MQGGEGTMAKQTEGATQSGAHVTEPLFDPDRLAELEVAGWRAYYSKRWAKMLVLLLQLSREQFGFSWPRALQAAYYIVRASVAWKPVDHDVKVVRRYLRKFYRLARQHGSRFQFEPKEVADAELRYWFVSRKYSTTPWREDSPLIKTMTDLHAALFRISPEAAYPSGYWRARSLHELGIITGGRSTDLESDWARVEELLHDGYRRLLAAIESEK
jgi:hypothetical protein